MVPVQELSAASRQDGAFASAQADADALGVRRRDAESGVPLGVDLRILLAGLVQGRRLEVFHDRRRVRLGRAQ